MVDTGVIGRDQLGETNSYRPSIAVQGRSLGGGWGGAGGSFVKQIFSTPPTPTPGIVFSLRPCLSSAGNAEKYRSRKGICRSWGELLQIWNLAPALEPCSTIIS